MTTAAKPLILLTGSKSIEPVGRHFKVPARVFLKAALRHCLKEVNRKKMEFACKRLSLNDAERKVEEQIPIIIPLQTPVIIPSSLLHCNINATIHFRVLLRCLLLQLLQEVFGV